MGEAAPRTTLVKFNCASLAIFSKKSFFEKALKAMNRIGGSPV